MGKNGSTAVYKVVLTGGPCGGKTTAQSRICTFFENLGWKVYRVPETAATLLGGGVKFSDLDENETYNFQKNLVKVMMAIEDTFFTLASTCKRNCLVICDRGTMDASAYIQPEKWERIIREINLNPVDIRDNRYNQIIHLVTAARGAKEFYATEENCSRYESPEVACDLDLKTSSAWVGHPYYDVIDNATDFEMKQMKVIKALCQRMGVETGDRLAPDASKIKFLVAVPLPPDDKFPPFQDFDVVHDYLTSATRKVQARLRKRGQKGNWTYSHTIRGPEILGQTPETKMQISHREYVTMMAERSPHNYSVFKTRRCFLWQNQYFQMDIYREPCHPRCQGLVLLETYSTLPSSQVELPPFLDILRECTGDPQYSMYNLSLKEDWANSTKFIVNLSDDDSPSKTPEISATVNGTL